MHYFQECNFCYSVWQHLWRFNKWVLVPYYYYFLFSSHLSVNQSGSELPDKTTFMNNHYLARVFRNQSVASSNLFSISTTTTLPLPREFNVQVWVMGYLVTGKFSSLFFSDLFLFMDNNIIKKSDHLIVCNKSFRWRSKKKKKKKRGGGIMSKDEIGRNDRLS